MKWIKKEELCMKGVLMVIVDQGLLVVVMEERLIEERKCCMKENGEFYYLKVAYTNGRREGKAEMKCMGEEKPVCILCYQSDKLNRQCACFNENGHVFECMVKDDVLDGPFAEYDEKGNVICQGEYKNRQRMQLLLMLLIR